MTTGTMPREDGAVRPLANRRIFVAGGTGNVGRELVSALIAAGATTAVSSRSAAKLAALRAHVGDSTSEAPAERLVTIDGDIADTADSSRVLSLALERLGAIDAAVASLGTFVPTESLLAAGTTDLRRVLDSYVLAHHTVARTLIPALQEQGGSYVIINGMLGHGYMFPGAALVSVAGAAQAHWARLLMRELEQTNVRANEVVVYSSFGRPDDDQRNRGRVGKSDVTGFVVQLLSAAGAAVRGRSLHLKSRDVMEVPGAAAGTAADP